jgi:hypothetical protein
LHITPKTDIPSCPQDYDSILEPLDGLTVEEIHGL